MTKRKTKTPGATSKTDAKAKKSAKGAQKTKLSAKTKKQDASSGEGYVVLARKYRPQTFDQLIGQEAMVRTLQNAFQTERIAQAYMLTGVRGIGKTTTARILARALNYELEGSARDKSAGPSTELVAEGVHCREIMESRHPDVLELDAASNTSVENIREIIESVRYRPVTARYKVYIIDEVHMLSRGAFNALLKTLEEPPEHVKFIFATTEIRKVPVTVLSRCQRFDLRRVEIPVLVDHLKSIADCENTEISPDALHMIARSAEGSVRDGLSILDQAIAMGAGSVSGETVKAMLGLADRSRIYDLLESVLAGQVKESLEMVAGLYMDGVEPVQILSDLAEAIHAATRIKTAGVDAAPDSLTTADSQRMAEMATKLGMPALARAWQMVLKGMTEVAQAPDTRIAVEMLLIRMAHMSDLPSPDELIRRFQAGSTTARKNTASPQAGPNGGADYRAPQAKFDTSDNAPPHPAPNEAAQSMGNDTSAPTSLNSFEELLAFLEARRDVKLLTDVERHFRLVSFEDGRLEVNLTDNTPKKLVGLLSQKLSQWTGRRWVVIVSGEEGAPTIVERRQADFDRDYDEIKDHPTIRAAREHFPDAEITAIRKLDELDEDGEAEDTQMRSGSERKGRE